MIDDLNSIYNGYNFPIPQHLKDFLSSYDYGTVASSPSLSYSVSKVPPAPSGLTSSVLENQPTDVANSDDWINKLASTVGKTASSAASGGVIGPITAAIQAATGVIDLLDGLFDWSGRRKQQQDQFNKQVELQNETWAREDSAIQRRVADLEAAGLSKTLAAGSAAATSSPIAHTVPNAMEGISGGIKDMMHGFGQSLSSYMLQTQIENQLAIQKQSLISSKLTNLAQVQALNNSKIDNEVKEIALDKLRYSAKFIPVEYWINLLSGLIGPIGSTLIKKF